jgi:two-component system alkaline phosphatase synthesis response regulator PhoP
MLNEKNKILIVEDEQDIRDLLIFNLQKEGFKVESVDNGDSALSLIRKNNFDLILLDLMLPGIGGFDLTRILKNDKKTSEIPIVMLTAKGEEGDIVKGLELGVDDYITKPFSIKVLLARINKIFKYNNQQKSDEHIISHGKILINLKSRDVIVEERNVNLTFTEFEILKLLASHSKWVYTRNEIINNIRGDDYIVTDRTIDFQIVGLRKKMGPAGKFIKTVRGVGYRFMVD